MATHRKVKKKDDGTRIAQEEWNFTNCTDEEVEHCAYYEFARESEKAKGEDRSASDLLVGSYEFCETRGWQPFPTNDLRSQLPKHMLEVHKSKSRHDIQRGAMSVRGHKHIGLVNGGQDHA